ncbi:WhiB family transcriptional regulator [Streptomyces sp. MB22_4]|uniref:WhiB family transcriptional regulator n=1 Tax=Streptomyces sp. MB22_4 TaxID=3383120 RepID=UPI0039A3A2D8
MNQVKSSEELRREWVAHPHFKYRGCAPDPDDPKRMAGNPELHVGAHNAPDAWSPEGQKERRAREGKAIEVCLNCPVMVQCDAYASSVGPDGKLAEPEGVWGGRRSLERHKALIKARHARAAAPVRAFETEQKQAVLQALAVCWDPFEVAAAASRVLVSWGEAPIDVRTANWQRSSLVRLLGLPKTVSRMRALAVARERGLLDGVVLVPDDGSVPAIPPPTRVPSSSEPATAAPPVADLAERRPVVTVLLGRRLRRTRVIPGQQSLFPADAALGVAA